MYIKESLPEPKLKIISDELELIVLEVSHSNFGRSFHAGADTDGCNRCSCNRQISSDANLAEIFSFLEHRSSLLVEQRFLFFRVLRIFFSEGIAYAYGAVLLLAQPF